MALAGWAGVPAVSGASPADRGAVGATAATSYDITLITGDLVHLTDRTGGRDVVTVERAEGSSGAVQVQTYGDDTYVVPEEAMPLLAAGKLDPRLFEVTELAAMGYDDARSGTVPVITTAVPGARSARPPAPPAGATAVRTLASIRATALHADKRRARSFWDAIAPAGASDSAPRRLAAGIGKVWLDGRVEAALAESTAQIAAPGVWAKGYDGTGVKVAVLDTGADLDHPDLRGQVVEARSFVAGEGVDDGNGHGTHVASTVAGSGAASGGKEKGAAPGARLLVGKVLGDSGYGADSATIAGMEWAKAQGADIVSMSLGSSTGSDGEDPMSLALDALSADGGPLFVVAAGNSYAPGTVGAPGAARSALTVAAVDRDDRRAAFSSQGPLTGSYALKPDVAAPGVDILAAASQQVPGWTGGMYRTMSGTSMATPLVSGAAALVKQLHPDWDGARVKNALMSTSHAAPGLTPYEAGTGRVDVLAAVGTTVEATGSVAAAVHKWPNADARPTTRTVTYRNTGTEDVTLALAVDTTGRAATLAQQSVTVPAGGTAGATLTLDPSQVLAGTTLSGRVIATAPGSGRVVAHTGFALFKEREMYDYTIEVTGPDGEPATDTVVVNTPGSDTPMYVNVTGRTTLRLPPGDYTAWSFMDVPGDSPDSLGKALLLAPNGELDADHPKVTAVLDASSAHRAYAVPERESETTQTVVDFSRAHTDGPVTSGRNWNSAVLLPAAYDSVYLAPTDEVEEGSLDVLVHWRMREKALDAATGTGHHIDLTAQAGTVFHDGESTLRTVYAGKGTAADYAGVDARGKAVVVDRSDEVTLTERVRAATDAGAAMLISGNDAPGRLYERYDSTDEVTVASVTAGVGARLVTEAKSGKGTLHVRQKQFPDYTYDLLRSYGGHVPDNPSAYRPGNGDLARVDAAYFAAPGTLGQGSRFFVPTWGPAVGGGEREGYGRTVTEYVTPAPSGLGRWYEQHAGTGDAAGYREQNEEVAYAAGRRYEGAWFKPVQAPRLDDSHAAYSTVSGTLQWNVPMWSGGNSGHAGFGGTGTRTVLYRAGDGAQVAAFNAQSGRAFSLPTGSYRLTATGQRTSPVWQTSTRTRTTWAFDFERPAPGSTTRTDVPLLNVDYDVETDLQGRAPAGRPLTLTLRAATAPAGHTARTATLQVSYDDGATWQQPELTAAGAGRWTTVLHPPRDGRALSLRVTAQAPGGLGVEQEVIRAIGLR
ncbi:peptidase [Streptomyces hydrogenans]|uniref:Peptidase n=2 Tax=Streptomyces hydrogenans TaxID=1873719 RepID=A0ABQ3PSW1_9ACTN|nr:peptidase [Streptomyces hydrogenans]GHI28099.1 peptidase [Streptomyces hydrogenans]